MMNRHDRRFSRPLADISKIPWKTGVSNHSRRLSACVRNEADSVERNPEKRSRSMLRRRNAYGAKYVEIDEYTSEKRE